MDQVKIGKFIAECRKKKGLTQEQLANMLNITNKAISKWENGRCLMDISLLNPLSKILDVSVLEIINGEYIDKNSVYEKSNEILTDSFSYADKKIKSTRIKTALIVVITFILIILMSFIIYKAIILKRYYVPRLNNNDYYRIVESLNNQNEFVLYKKTISDDDYLSFNNIKIRNDFKDFELETIDDLYSIQKYIRYNDNKIESFFWISNAETYIDYYKSDAIFFVDKEGVDLLSTFNKSDRGYLLLRNDINNDIDLFNYIKNNYYINSSILTSRRQILENSSINAFINIFNTPFSSITIINGDYLGYIFNYDNGIKEVNILRNNKRYIFTFGGTIANDNYIKDLMSTLEISVDK